MTPGLRVGDEVTLRDAQRSKGKVVQLSGSVVTVLLEDTTVVALAFNEFYDKTGDGELPKQKPKRPEVDNDDVLESARQLAAHIIEVETGIRPGNPGPLPGYDPLSTTITARQERKVDELKTLHKDHPHHMSGTSFARYRKRYAEHGVTGLIDKRKLKQKTRYGRQHPKVIELMKEQLEHSGPGSTLDVVSYFDYLTDRFEAYNATADERVKMPSLRTVERILRGMPEARFFFDNAKHRVSKIQHG